jgi:hypothetical protein
MPILAELTSSIHRLNSNLVFSEKNGKTFLGAEEISKKEREILKADAEYFKRSSLLEVISNTIQSEAIDMGLLDSKEWNHVLSAKSLWHWNHVLNKIISKLAE